MQSILVIEDSLEIQRIMQDCLKNCSLTQVTSLAEANREILKAHFDLIILDVELPDGDGMKFCANLKNQQALAKIPIIFLTNKNNTEDIVMGFQLGAEDYVTKPFNPFEFRARIEAKLRKQKSDRQEQKIRLDNLLIDIDRQKVTAVIDSTKKQELSLTPLEFKILSFLARHHEHVYSREQLIERIWGNGVSIGDRVVDTHISNIRKKMGVTEYTIDSIYGTGYSFQKKKKAS